MKFSKASQFQEANLKIYTVHQFCSIEHKNVFLNKNFIYQKKSITLDEPISNQCYNFSHIFRGVGIELNILKGFDQQSSCF